MKITKYAKSISPSGQIKNRVDEALNTLNEMRFRDAHQIIAFLNQVISVYEQVEKENSGIDAIISGRRSVVNEDKIMEAARPLLENKIIEKIAKSEKDDLIKDFFNSLNKLTNKISTRNSVFFNKKKSAFLSCLPITNSIKYNFEKSKLENELNKLQKDLSNTRNKKMFASGLQSMESEMSKIKEWQLFRSSETREQQIAEQKKKIDNLVLKGEAERKKEISRIEEQVVIKNRELKSLEK